LQGATAFTGLLRGHERSLSGNIQTNTLTVTGLATVRRLYAEDMLMRDMSVSATVNNGSIKSTEFIYLVSNVAL
jgi:hypothetical protein